MRSFRDFIDVFLLEVRKTTDSTSMFYGKEAGMGLPDIYFKKLFDPPSIEFDLNVN